MQEKNNPWGISQTKEEARFNFCFSHRILSSHNPQAVRLIQVRSQCMRQCLDPLSPPQPSTQWTLPLYPRPLDLLLDQRPMNLWSRPHQDSLTTPPSRLRVPLHLFKDPTRASTRVLKATTTVPGLKATLVEGVWDSLQQEEGQTWQLGRIPSWQPQGVKLWFVLLVNISLRTYPSY